MPKFRYILLTCCLLGATVIGSVASAQTPEEHDRFGGWTGLKFDATGFFRLEKAPERWWLVTPEGNAYLIHGMDHVVQGALTRPYSKEHWDKKLGLPADATPRQRAEVFYRQKLAADRDYLGFNCLYSHQAPVGMNVCPYIPRVQTVHNEYWNTRWPGFTDENFLDVFSPRFAEQCNESAARMVNNRWVDDPWIVGYGLTDSPVLSIQMAMPHHAGFFHKPLPGTTTWPVRLRNLDAAAPGKQAYVTLMRSRYDGRIEEFNAYYNTAWESWRALLGAENWRPRTDPTGNMHEEADNHAFLLEILDKSWSTQVAAIRRRDPNHLIFGDTLNMNEPIPDDVIRLYVKHFPIITYQYYGATAEDHKAVMDRFRRVAPDVPIFSADSSWSVCDPPRMPDTLGPQCANHSIRADRFDETYRMAFSRPDFLGWGWCGWMDRWESHEPHMQHSGLQDAFGRWHQPMADRMSQFGKEMYRIATLSSNRRTPSRSDPQVPPGDSRGEPVRVRVDFAQERGRIPRNISGMLTDPPRSYNYMMNPNAGKTGRDNPRIELDKDDPSAEGMNAVWLEALKPSIAGLGWGGDVWYVFDPWPAENVYDWAALDAWIESHLARGTAVSLKFSLVPRWLWSEQGEEESGAAQQFFPYLKQGHVMPPSDYEKWEELVYQTVRHLNIEKKYNVRFEPWNEPNARFWLGTQQQHLEMYERTAKAIRSADPKSVIGGPTLTSVRRNWLEPFLKHCAENDVPLDFISWHYYLWHGLQAGHVQSFAEQAAEVRSLVEQYPSLGNPELCVSEWAYMWYNTDMPSPTFNAAFTLQSFYEMLDGGISTSYYCGPLGPTKSPDPAVSAFMMYNAMDAMRVEATVDGEGSDIGVLAARGSESMSLLLWSYPFDAHLVSQPPTPPGTPPKRRQEFQQKRMQTLNDMVADEMKQPAKHVELALENLPEGEYTYERYLVDAAHCSQLMEKVEQGRTQVAEGRSRFRIALEPYALTLIKLKRD